MSRLGNLTHRSSSGNRGTVGDQIRPLTPRGPRTSSQGVNLMDWKPGSFTPAEYVDGTQDRYLKKLARRKVVSETVKIKSVSKKR